MRREKAAASWLNPFAALIGPDRAAPPPALRHLRGERLENRLVLSAAPVEAPQGQSLADYLAHEHSMGPTLPIAIVSAAAAEGAVAAAPAPATPPTGPDLKQLAATMSPQTIDQWFGAGYGDGAGEGEGSGSGSGGGSGSGSGAGSGSGSGSGSSSGSSGGQDPGMTTTEVETSDGTMTISGYLTDNRGAGNVSMSIEGADGSVSVDSDGNFTLNIIDTGGNQSFTVTITDGDGNATTYTFSF